MVNITIRNLSEDLIQRLRIQATEHGRSLEEEAREILRAVLAEDTPPVNLPQAIRARFAPLGGVELEIPPRELLREPPSFD